MRLRQKFAGLNMRTHFGGGIAENGTEAILDEVVDIIEQLEEVDDWHGDISPNSSNKYELIVDCPHAVFIFDILWFGEQMAILESMSMECLDDETEVENVMYGTPTLEQWFQVFVGLHTVGMVNVN